MTTSHAPLSHHVREGVGVITLDRRGKHNALTQLMWAQIPTVIHDLTASESVSCVLLQGAHGSFSAGADLTEVLEATSSPEAAENFCRTVVDALLAVAECPVPTIAQMRGIASGGGAELALACDLRFADESARLQLPLAGLGVVPDEFTLHRLVTLAGSATARYLLMTGRTLDAAASLRHGLVHQVVPESELAECVAQVITELGTKSRYAMSQTKELLVRRELALAEQAMTAPMVASFLHGDVATNARAFLGDRAIRRNHREALAQQEDS